MLNIAPTGAVMQLQLANAPRFLNANGSAIALAARDAALLAWLALEGPTLRARMAVLLWPDSDADVARNALRQRLFQLRKSLGVDAIVGSATLTLAEGLTHDLEDADSVLGDAAPAAGGEFAAWLEQQRQRRRGRTRQSLAELAQMAEDVRDWGDALAHAQDLLALEPTSEAAHRRVMRLHYLAGDRASALLAFDRCEQMLKDEIGARPSAETLALLASIEAQRVDRALPLRVLPVNLLRPPQLIGRDRERDALAAAWTHGQAFLALGDAGIGKTRLLASLAAQWPGALLLQARPGDLGVPLVLVARLVDALCDRQPAWAGRACVQTLRDVLARSPQFTPQTAPQIAPQIVKPGAVRPVPRACAPPLSELLALGLAATPTLALLFDDLQFADEASLAVLDETLRTSALAGLRWGWASRPHGELAAARIESLRARSDLHCVNLLPLDGPAIAQFVDSLQLGGTNAAGLAAALQQSVGGNPMYLLESLRRIVDQGRPLQACKLSTPRRVQDLVEARLADLPAGQRLLMRVAAIAGADFDVGLAEAVSGRGVLELADDWRSLERQALFDERGIGHDLYAEATLAELPAAIARALHGRVAAWLETRTHDSARLAAHWMAGRDELRASPHLLAAARKAWRAACPEETLSFYRQAAEIAVRSGAPDTAFDHWFDAAEALSEIGSPALLSACALALQGLARSPQQGLRSQLVGAVLQVVGGQPEAGLRAARNLLSEAIAIGDVRVEVECRFAIANRAAADGAFDEAVQQLAAGERLLREAGDTRRAAALSSSMVMVLALRGQPRRAIAEQERLLPILAREGDLATWTVACASKALQHVYSGDAVRAVLEAERAAQSAQQASIAPQDSAIILRYVVDTLRWAGRFDLALSSWQTLASRLAGQGSFPGCADVAGLLYLQLGRVDLAQPHLDAYLALPRTRRREQLRSSWVRACRACWSATPPAHIDWPDDALQCEDLALASGWGLLSGLVSTSPWPLGEIAALADRCDAAGVALFGVALRALQARRAMEAGSREAGAALARGAERASAGLDLHGGTPWAALYLAQALQLAAAGDVARRVAQHGAAWVQRTARDAMPPEFRASFLHRNPVNRELLALAARITAS